MELSLLLIILGIVVAILVSWVVGVIMIVAGLALMLVPRMRDGSWRTRGA